MDQLLELQTLPTSAYLQSLTELQNFHKQE